LLPSPPRGEGSKRFLPADNGMGQERTMARRRPAVDPPEKRPLNWRELVGKAAFLKVGRHGSHDVTPKEFVEKCLPAGVPAMVPVGNWPSIPRKPLLRELRKRRVKPVRSDDVGHLPAGFVRGDGYVEVEIPVGA
jgi:hypothetical protein